MSIKMNKMIDQAKHRSSGRTNRIKNFCIDRLIHEGRVVVNDHHPSKEGQEELVRELLEDPNLNEYIFNINQNAFITYSLKHTNIPATNFRKDLYLALIEIKQENK